LAFFLLNLSGPTVEAINYDKTRGALQGMKLENPKVTLLY
jgi:hypothetical protein